MGDRDRYAAALNVWDMHLSDANFSVPPHEGVTAILCPYIEPLNYSREEGDDYTALRNETYSIADSMLKTGRAPVVALKAKLFDFSEALKDPSISDIILIGHGCLASVEIDNPDSQNRLDWEDLAIMADHLKTGNFAQRLCGMAPRVLNVPIGLMVVNGHNHVFAPVGRRFNPVGMDDPQNEKVKPVTSLTRMTYEDIKREFPQQKLPIMSRAHVALGAMKRKLSPKLPRAV